jgi:8-oxo-dGTP diphosphatase
VGVITLPGAPAVLAVDVAAFTATEGALGLVLVRRRIAPYVGSWALPGGFVLAEETTTQAAQRELVEEAGIRLDRVHIEQLATYADPGRDPRARVVSVAHVAFVPGPLTPRAGSDAVEAALWPVDQLALGDRSPVTAIELAFDHAQIVTDALERVRAKLEYTTLATRFVPRTFTMSELRQVYETVWAVALDPANFAKKVLSCEGFVQQASDAQPRAGQVGRPPRRYRAAGKELSYLRRPLLRPES